jgi:hypothetical protein
LARPKQPRDILLLLIALAIALFVFQYVTLAKLSVLPPSKSYNSVALYADEVRRFVTFHWADAVLAGLIVALVLAIVFVEIRKGRLSLFLGHAFASEKRTLLLLGLASLVLVRFYFARGELSWAADAAQHIVYSHITAEALARGELPVWTNYLSTGSPYLQFYGFLFFYLVALVFLVCRDLFVSLKLVLAAAHVASGIAMYLLARLVCRSRRAGFLAALGYVLTVWHTQQVLAMGRLPLSLFYALLPLPFYCFERLRSSCRSWPAVAGGIALGLLILTHPGYSLWAAAFLAIYMTVRLWENRARDPVRPAASYSLLLLAVGLLFGACLTLPMWVDRGHTGLHAGFELASIPSPTLQHLLVWSNFRFRLLPLPASSAHWYGGYLGLSLVALAVAGLVCPLWEHPERRSGRCVAAGVCLVGATLLALGYRWPLVRSLPLLHTMSAERYLLFAAFFLALAAGAGARCALHLLRQRLPQVPPMTLLFSALLLDLGPTTVQNLYLPVESTVDPTGYPATMFAPFRAEADPYRRKGELPGYRIFWSSGPIHGYLAMNRLQFLTGTASPHGPHPGELRAVSCFVKPLEAYLAEILGEAPDLGRLVLSPEYADVVHGGMALLAVRYLLVTQNNGGTRTLDLPAHTPILVSPRIAGLQTAGTAGSPSGVSREQMRTQEGLSTSEQVLMALWLIRQMRPDASTRTCQQLLLLDYDGQEDLGTQPSVEVIEHHVWNQRVEMRVRTSSDCYARLAYAYFPYLRVEVDGKQVSPLQTADRFIGLRLGPGEHWITLVPYLSPLRRWLLALDGVLLLAGIWIWRRERRQRSSR